MPFEGVNAVFGLQVPLLHRVSLLAENKEGAAKKKIKNNGELKVMPDIVEKANSDNGDSAILKLLVFKFI